MVSLLTTVTSGQLAQPPHYRPKLKPLAKLAPRRASLYMQLPCNFLATSICHLQHDLSRSPGARSRSRVSANPLCFIRREPAVKLNACRCSVSAPTVISRWPWPRRPPSTTPGGSNGNRPPSTSRPARSTSSTSRSTSRRAWWSSGPGPTTGFRLVERYFLGNDSFDRRHSGWKLFYSILVNIKVHRFNPKKLSCSNI